MSENRICKLPCSQYKPDGPTDLGVGGWCLEHYHPCLLVECQRRDIIEAVLAGVLSKADIDAIGYSLEHPNDRLVSLEKEWRVIWDGRTYSIEKEKPCSTCGGKGTPTLEEAVAADVDRLEPLGKSKRVSMFCPTCKGEGMTATMIPPSRVIEDVDCPTREGKHFVPGKGREM